MSIVDDTRKVLQDFLSPELRELKARLDALEKRMDERFGNAEKLAETRHNALQNRFDQSEALAASRYQAILTSLNAISDMNEFRERLARLESRESMHQ